MVVDEIAMQLEKRRYELVHMLENDKELELEKQHQVYGAINEIDVFLQTLHFYRQQGSNDPIKLMKAPQDPPGIFSKIKSIVKRN